MRRRKQLIRRLIEKVWPPRLVDILACIGGTFLIFGFAGLGGAIDAGEGYLFSSSLVAIGCIVVHFYIKEGGD